ncbi:MAG: hypothetical protein HKN48_04535, partial [Flavobacteriaceae bacterium]|nr:hypothetical protein [Flavobacteriaceae bacterium]
KMLISNLKSIGTPAKIVLFVLWLGSIIGLGILGIRQATETAFDGEYINEYTLPVRTGDTLNIKMVSNDKYEYDARRRGRLDIKYDENDEKLIYSTDVRLIVRSTTDSIGRIVIEKRAEGSDYLAAKDRAQAINYDYNYDSATSSLGLNAYLTTDFENKYRDQEVEVIVYLPIGSVLYADDNTYSFHRNDSYYRDILDNGDEEKYLIIEDGATRCLECPEKTSEEWEDDWTDKDGGVYIKNENGEYIKIDEDGLKIQDDDGDKLIIDEDGIEIESKDPNDSINIKIGN